VTYVTAIHNTNCESDHDSVRESVLTSSCDNEEDYGDIDYRVELCRLHNDQVLLEMYNLHEKWGYSNKFWIIMLIGSAMLYSAPISKRLIKFVQSHVTTISSSIMSRQGKTVMKRALALYDADGHVDLEHILPNIRPFTQVVEDYDELIEDRQASPRIHFAHIF
jgi:hypothetical protein